MRSRAGRNEPRKRLALALRRGENIAALYRVVNRKLYRLINIHYIIEVY
jgi:hypothetical protein